MNTQSVRKSNISIPDPVQKLVCVQEILIRILARNENMRVEANTISAKKISDKI